MAKLIEATLLILAIGIGSLNIGTWMAGCSHFMCIGG